MASVQGTGNFDPTVSWSASAGTINSTGKTTAAFIAPANLTGNVVITATSTVNTTKAGKTSIKVVLPPPTAAFQVVGPGGGNFFSIASDPSAPLKVYASALQAGIYASDDGGSTWKSFGTNMPADPRPGVVFAVSAVTGTVYAGTAAGVFKTANGGQSWSALPSLPAPSSNVAAAIAADPINDSILYVTDRKGGVYRSGDSGGSWSTINLPTTCAGSITVDLVQSGKVYFGSCSGFYVSVDSGATWNLLSNTGISIGAVVQARGTPQRLYAVVSITFPLVNLYKSGDGGVTWTQILRGDQIAGIVVDPVDADQVFALTWEAFTTAATLHGLVKTTDGGQTWNQLGFPTLTPDYTHPYLGLVGPGSLLVTSSAPQVFLAQTATHLWRVENSGALWTESDQGLTGTFGLQVAVDPITPTSVYLIAANGSGISKSTDSGKTWAPTLTAGGEAIAVDPFDSQHILASFSLADPLSATNSTIQVSHDAGVTWEDAPAPATQGLPAAAIVFDPSTQGTVYLGFPWQNAKLGVAKSTDGGGSWAFTNSGLTGSALIVESLAVDPLNPSVVIAGTDGGIYKSADAGLTWTLKSSSDISFSIALDPNQAGVAYASGQVLLKSSDDGETWAAVNVGRSDLVPPLTLAIDPSTADTLFLIPFGGPAVGWTPDGGVTWFWLSDGIAGNLLGGNLSHPAIAKTTPETLYIPSPNVGVLSLTLQH